MTAVVIILGIGAAVGLALYLLKAAEIRSIRKQLHELKGTDTNSLIHSKNGSADKLINEINQLIKDTRTLKIDYQKKNHALEQMMTNISHDLRTPLTSAMGYINILQNSDISEEEKQREITIIENRLIRLEELINSFFELSQTISSGKPPELSQLNLVSVLEESIVHYYDDYCSKNRQIILQCNKHKLMISSNRNMLLRIFDNLINNSLKHGCGDLVITVAEDNAIAVEFKNNLPSAELDIDHIFDEFYTTDISRTKGNTGLGLAIAKQFTEILGGSINASVCEGYFTMTVKLTYNKEEVRL